MVGRPCVATRPRSLTTECPQQAQGPYDRAPWSVTALSVHVTARGVRAITRGVHGITRGVRAIARSVRATWAQCARYLGVVCAHCAHGPECYNALFGSLCVTLFMDTVPKSLLKKKNCV